MKFAIIGVAMLLVLAGGGGAAWWFLLREPPEEAVVEEAPLFPEMVFVDFDPMVVSVLRDGQVINHLTFMIIVEVPDQESRGVVFRQTTRLRDAFRTELHAVLSRRFMQERGDIMPILSKRLKTVAVDLVGGKAVERVLVNIMTQRDLREG